MLPQATATNRCDSDWAVLLSGQASLDVQRPAGAALSCGSYIRAMPGRQTVGEGNSRCLGGRAAIVAGQAAVLGAQSLNVLFCSKNSPKPLLSNSQKYET